GEPPLSLSTGDLTGDGHVDVLVSFTTLGAGRVSTVALFSGDGSGRFNMPVEVAPRGTIFFDSLVADLDLDGRQDFITIRSLTGYGNYKVVQYLHRSDGTFEAVPLAQPDAFTGPTMRALQLRDLNDDGHLDLTVLTGYAWSVQFGAAAGLTGPTASYQSLRSGSSGVAFFDADADGVDDAVLVRSNPLGVELLLAQ
ncbi:MAG: VCBS repeat-containing protein, partial [Archangium sp.]|nr:VCBS repeat-containing protein [Archangium sp.]